MSDISGTGATLNIANYSGAWYYQRTAGPADATCHTVSSGATATLSSLTADTFYAYTAYSDSSCATALDTATFATPLTVSNLSESVYSDCLVTSSRKCAVGFTTGGSAGGYTLAAITASFDYADADSDDLIATLHADNSGVPASATLATLSGSNPENLAHYTYACSGNGCALAANTTYFVQFTADDNIEYIWYTTNSDAETLVPAGIGWSLANGAVVHSERVLDSENENRIAPGVRHYRTRRSRRRASPPRRPR